MAFLCLIWPFSAMFSGPESLLNTHHQQTEIKAIKWPSEQTLQKTFKPSLTSLTQGGGGRADPQVFS